MRFVTCAWGLRTDTTASLASVSGVWCQRERIKERERDRERERVCVCVCERERERERGGGKKQRVSEIMNEKKITEMHQMIISIKKPCGHLQTRQK